MLRALVSKKKRRFQADGFDLDLTYITPRVIAMGAPSEGSEAAYRNPLSEVVRFFEARHAGCYRLLDLRGEKGAGYAAERFGGAVARYPFYDHNPAPLSTIAAAVADMHAWLAAAPENVVAVHCKAGKGRTGLIVAAYLLFAGLQPSATAALRAFGEARAHDGKGVTIPSQQRYVHYWEARLRRPPAAVGGAGGAGGAGGGAAPPTYRLRHLRMHTVPNFDVGGGCDPFFDVRLGDGKNLVFCWRAALGGGGRLKHYMPRQRVVDFDLAPFNVRVRGDVKLVLYDWDAFSAPEKMCHLWFNTGFIDDNYLLFHKDVIDRASKDRACKHFEPDFKLEIFLTRVDAVEGEFDGVDGVDGGGGGGGGRAGGGGGGSERAIRLDADNDDDLDDEDEE